MTIVVPISRNDERLEAASRWIVKLDEGLSREDEAALESWLAEHPGNAAELVEVAQAWDKLDCLSRLADMFPIEPPAAGRPVSRTRRRAGPAPAWFAAAAGVLATIAIAWYTGLPRGAGEQDSLTVTAQRAGTYETAIGEHRLVTLADGTALTLNTNSRVSVRYTEAARLIRLQQGEIHVAVARDPARPLSVIAGDRIVQAVGTAFTVELVAGRQLELVVTEGKVLIGLRPPDENPDRVATMTAPDLQKSPGTRTVSAGQELIVREAEEVVVPVSAEDLEVELAWRDGRLIFRNEPLEKAIAEIERYTTVEFVFLDDSLRTQSISGRYKTGDVAALLLALRANFDIDYEYDGENRILLRNL